MKRKWILGQFLLIAIAIPALACGPVGINVTPTPTKTPKIIKTLPPLETATPIAIVLPTNTPTSMATDTPTPTPVPPTDTPTPVPTDTPPPPPTSTPPPPPPPPPPTNTPPPPEPTQPPPPTEPSSSKPQVTIELPDGNTHDKGDEFKVVFIARDPDGVSELTWGIFTQNQVSLQGGTIDCRNRTECIHEEEVSSPLKGIFIVGADVVDANGAQERGIGEIYIR